MELILDSAIVSDAPEVAALRNAVARELTARYGVGHWSSAATETGLMRNIETSRVLVARQDGRIAGTLRLVTKKPWAIDRTYFTSVPRPLYLLDMAVLPELQRHGVGRRLLAAADGAARSFPAQAIRLDAYDGPMGAGEFYSRCGYVERGRVAYRGVPLVYFERLLPAE